MYCPECGTEVSEDSMFCMNCGEELSKSKNDAKTQSTNNNGEGSQPSSDTNNEYGSSQTGIISRRGIIASLSLAGIGAAGGGGYWILREPETIIPLKTNINKNGVRRQQFKINEGSYFNVEERSGADVIYSNSENSIFYARGMAYGIGPVDFDDFPRANSTVLPAGEYTLLSNYASPRIEISPVFFFRNKRVESFSLDLALDYLSKMFVGFIYTPVDRSDSYRSHGYNLSERITGTSVGTKLDRFVRDINYWIEAEEIVKYMAQKSNSKIKERYERIAKQNELWRSGLLTCASVISSIDNLYGDLISNISSEVNSLDGIPTNFFNKSMNLLSKSDNTNDVAIGFYTTAPQYETEGRVTVPIGIYIYINTDVPFNSKLRYMYTPTVSISSVKTRDDGAPSLQQRYSPGESKTTSMWEPVVSDIQSELIDKFSNSL